MLESKTNKGIRGCVRTPCLDIFCRSKEGSIIFSWEGEYIRQTVVVLVTPALNIGIVYGNQHWQRCPHFPEAVCRPWEMRAILTSAKPWKDDSWKANDKCKPCSKKQGGLEKKTMCYGSKFRPWDLLTTNNWEVKGQILGITKGQHILESSGSPLIWVMSGLMNDPYLRIMLHRMKA